MRNLKESQNRKDKTADCTDIIENLKTVILCLASGRRDNKDRRTNCRVFGDCIRKDRRILKAYIHRIWGTRSTGKGVL